MINLNKKRPGPWDDDDLKNDYDKCVSCDEVTEYLKHDHVDYRIAYIEGAGQLCLNCYDEIYVKKKNNSSDESSQYIVGQYAHNNSE